MEVSKIMFAFELLDVWHKALEFAGKIYKVTRYFQFEEKSGPVSQLKSSLKTPGFKKYSKL